MSFESDIEDSMERKRAEMGQSKKGSLAEAVANILVGVTVSFISQLIIFGSYGIHVSLGMNAEMTAWFTAVSLARSYSLRRLFNYFTIWQS